MRMVVDTPDQRATEEARAAVQAELSAHHPQRISLYHSLSGEPFAIIPPAAARAIAWDLLNLAELAEHAQEAP